MFMVKFLFFGSYYMGRQKTNQNRHLQVSTQNVTKQGTKVVVNAS